MFDGHYQPHLPADLGFYDLRLEEARLAQEALAKEYGIHGFCYYHYWFNEKRMLNEPLDRKMANSKEDLPFMLCWANENWTRRWDGEEEEILIQQKYSEADDTSHIHHLMNYFKDSRYIRVGSKPIFILYKPYLLPDPAQTLKTWRSIAADHGIELYICHCVFNYNPLWSVPFEGFDAVIDFEPFGIRHVSVFDEIKLLKNQSPGFFQKVLSKVGGVTKKDNVDPGDQYNILPYNFMFSNLKCQDDFPFKLYPSVVPGWDNSSRRKNNPTLILNDSTPEFFENWLRIIKEDFKPYSEEENFIFINAWNEWAEGNHLEPCQRWGVKYLEALSRVLGNVNNKY